MPEPGFIHSELRMIAPQFDSKLTDLIIDLNYLRRNRLHGSTEPVVFFQLKRIFQIMESIGSARIEGNNTTIIDYFESTTDSTQNRQPNIVEIHNIEVAMDFIDRHIADTDINRAFISEIHKIIVKDLSSPPHGEGDRFPGEYRTENVKINRAFHIPPDFTSVTDYVEELLLFINQKDEPKYDLLKIAIAHHRFVWIHPFRNGNGRTVRLLTYAMLVKQGFNVDVGRILNPTAVFCNNRDVYYAKLAEADSGRDDGILRWCEYVLEGLKIEIEKIDKLLDYDYLKRQILYPSLSFAADRKEITETEFKILKRVVENQIIQANDIKDIFKDKAKSEISRQIKMLKEKNLLMPEKEGKRSYTLNFRGPIFRGILKFLEKEGFLPPNEVV
jgi:Fic family protein